MPVAQGSAPASDERATEVSVVESDNERLVRRFVEAVVNRGDTDVLPTLIAADHVGHDPLGDHYGVDGVRITVAELRGITPDEIDRVRREVDAPTPLEALRLIVESFPSLALVAV